MHLLLRPAYSPHTAEILLTSCCNPRPFRGRSTSVSELRGVKVPRFSHFAFLGLAYKTPKVGLPSGDQPTTETLRYTMLPVT